MALIEATNVSKYFRQHKRFPGALGAIRSLATREFTEVVAIADVTFAISAGEAVGYLGPNGAGKSTMLKMLTGVLAPSSGTVSVFGRTPHLHRILNAREIGVVFGQRSQLWWDLPVIDSFLLSQRLYRVPDSRFRQNLSLFTRLLELDGFLDRPVRQLSLGQRMRCELVVALLHDPKILFLDEPTIGLDVVAKDVVRKFLGTVNREQGVTIVLTTHDLVDIEEICPRLIMVDDGRLLFDGPLKQLREHVNAPRGLVLEFEKDPGVIDLAGVELLEDEGNRKAFSIRNRGMSIVSILASLPSSAVIRDIVLTEPTIEEVIRSFYSTKR